MTAKQLPRPVVGMQVFLVLNNNARTTEHRTVATVGRKWATLAGSGNYRFNVDTWEVDSEAMGYAPRCYLNEQAYQEEKDLASMWSRFSRAVSESRQRPVQATLENIQKAAELLSLSV